MGGWILVCRSEFFGGRVFFGVFFGGSLVRGGEWGVDLFGFWPFFVRGENI